MYALMCAAALAAAGLALSASDLGSNVGPVARGDLGLLGAQSWVERCASAGGTCDQQNGCNETDLFGNCHPVACVACNVTGTQKACSFPGLYCFPIVGLNCNAGPNHHDGICDKLCVCTPLTPGGTCTGNTSSCL
jgi:hypothetical protein